MTHGRHLLGDAVLFSFSGVLRHPGELNGAGSTTTSEELSLLVGMTPRDICMTRLGIVLDRAAFPATRDQINRLRYGSSFPEGNALPDGATRRKIWIKTVAYEFARRTKVYHDSIRRRRPFCVTSCAGFEISQSRWSLVRRRRCSAWAREHPQWINGLKLRCMTSCPNATPP